jgi:hypothetical protein
MFEGQSQRSIASSVQHRQEAEVAAAVRAEVEAAATADAARAAVAKLEALRASSTGNSVFVDDDRDNELKLARKAVWEQVTQWAAAHPQGRRGGGLTGADAPAALWAGARATDVSPMAAGAQTGVDAPTTGLTETATFTGGVALPSRTGTMVTMGSKPLSVMSVPATGGLPSLRPTMSSGPR